MAARFCADDFFGQTRAEIYAFIKEAAYETAGECGVSDLSALRAYISEFDFEVVDASSTDTCAVILKVVFRVDLCDIDGGRLRKLFQCFQELKESDSVDIRARIATGIKEQTKGRRIASDADAENPTKLNSDGSDVQASAAEASVEWTDMDGNVLVFESTTEEPTETEASTTEARGSPSGAAGFRIVFGIVASFIVAGLS